MADKWHIGVRILKCSPRKMGIFQPEIMFCFVKWQDFGEPYKLDGRPEKKMGGWKTFEFPWGISIKIHR